MTKPASRSTKPNSTSHKPAFSPALIVLGYDDQSKPRGARFLGSEANLVIEAAKAMGLS